MRASPEPAEHGAPDETIALAGVAALAERFNGFIVDQWGVLHDGTRPYADALDCLHRLRAAGKRIVVLSNSGRGEAENLRIMQAMGFPARLFDRVVSAGEDARNAIAARSSAFHAKLGTRCLAFTRGGERAILEGLGLEFVALAAQADFVAVLGIDSPQRTLADYEADLQAARARGLPMLCANPDLVRPHAQGLVDAPGILARRYEALGGEVFYHGKPYPAIYASCLQALAGIAPERVIAIGDSVEHDVLGAQRAGLPSALVASGIHTEELGVAAGRLPDVLRWREFAHRAIARPDYLLPTFGW